MFILHPTSSVLTIDIGPMVQYGVEAGPITGVPDAYGVVPAARDEEVGDLSVPEQASHRCSVTTQYTHTRVLGVVPDTDGAGKSK